MSLLSAALQLQGKSRKVKKLKQRTGVLPKLSRVSRTHEPWHAPKGVVILVKEQRA